MFFKVWSFWIISEFAHWNKILFWFLAAKSGVAKFENTWSILLQIESEKNVFKSMKFLNNFQVRPLKIFFLVLSSKKVVWLIFVWSVNKDNIAMTQWVRGLSHPLIQSQHYIFQNCFVFTIPEKMANFFNSCFIYTHNQLKFSSEYQNFIG